MIIKPVLTGDTVRLLRTIYYGKLDLPEGMIFKVVSTRPEDLRVVSGINKNLCLAMQVQHPKTLTIIFLPINDLELVR